MLRAMENGPCAEYRPRRSCFSIGDRICADRLRHPARVCADWLELGRLDRHRTALDRGPRVFPALRAAQQVNLAGQRRHLSQAFDLPQRAASGRIISLTVITLESDNESHGRHVTRCRDGRTGCDDPSGSAPDAATQVQRIAGGGLLWSACRHRHRGRLPAPHRNRNHAVPAALARVSGSEPAGLPRSTRTLLDGWWGR